MIKNLKKMASDEVSVITTAEPVDYGFDAYMKKLIEETVKKEVDNRMYSLMCKIAEEKSIENKTLTAKELCRRWNISDNTLRSRENEGVIHPLETGGKKKIYSMKDIINVETSGVYKMVC
jgi:ribosomal protein S25